jgi:competence protein ComEC
MTLATPPVMRAFIAWGLTWTNDRQRLGWTRAQILTMSGAATLAVCRTRWDIGSLVLSWVAALALAWSGVLGDARAGGARGVGADGARGGGARPPIWRERVASFFARARSDLRAHAAVYVALIPALVPLGVPSALSILCNLLFAPVMGFVLFPVSVLGYAGFATLADRTWSIALACVKFAARFTPEPWTAREFSPVWLMPYIFALSLALLRRERKRRSFSSAIIAMALLAFTAAIALEPTTARADELIVWNVGQGSWATVKSKGLCEHFDLGGEFAPVKAVARACAHERNEVYFSHWDWDHIGLTRAALRRLPNLCLQARPGGETKSKTKTQLIAMLTVCESHPLAREINELRRGSANEESRVFLRDLVVFPGDSPARQEADWRVNARPARLLIAGHHGSKTSTSSKLLATLSRLKLIVVSARKSRYGHPHPAMLERARDRRLPVLTTEDWGHIHVEISGDLSGETPRSEKTRTEFRSGERPASRFRARGGGRNPATR